MVTESLKFLTEEMLALLKDGQWHRFGEFIPIVNKVPPEIGQRTYLRSHSSANYNIQKTLESQADGGRTILLKSRLRALVLRKQILVRGEKEEAEYMRNPDAPAVKKYRKTPDPRKLRKSVPIVSGVPNILDLSELKGQVIITEAEFLLPERKAFGELRKRGRRKKVSVMPVFATMLQIKGSVTLDLKLDGSKVIVEDIR